MMIDTLRFGKLDVNADDIVQFSEGLIGFSDIKRFFLVDPNDDTMILWLQSVDRPEISFPVLEPKIFKNDYVVRLSAQEMRLLKLADINKAKILSVLTIPAEISEMTANMKAPIVINIENRLGRQVVLQETEYNVKTPMFKELRVHMVTNTNMSLSKIAEAEENEEEISFETVNISTMLPSPGVQAL